MKVPFRKRFRALLLKDDGYCLYLYLGFPYLCLMWNRDSLREPDYTRQFGIVVGWIPYEVKEGQIVPHWKFIYSV
jgi:hypothetical protein